jgi:hypothetical protein
MHHVVVLTEPSIRPKLLCHGFLAECSPFEVLATSVPTQNPARSSSREEAITQCRQQAQSRLASGQELIDLVVERVPALPAGAGLFKDDPLFKGWQEAIAENRRKKDEEEGF